MTAGQFALTMTRLHDYEFTVRFEPEDIADLLVDESPPVGGGAGPSPTALLGAAVGSCLSSSLLFCLQKARVEVLGVTTRVRGTIARSDEGRLRVQGIEVHIAPHLSDPDAAGAARCADIFEQYCTVTGSVRHGIEVEVRVEPTSG